MLDLRIMTGAQALPIYDLPAALGRRGAAKELGAQIDLLIAFLDELGGDTDLEPDVVEADDVDGGSWPEWHTLPAVDQRAGRIGGRYIFGNVDIEDAEDDDPREDDDPDSCDAGEDSITAGVAPQYRHYAQITGWNGYIGSDDDAEPEWCGTFARDVADGTFAANDL